MTNVKDGFNRNMLNRLNFKGLALSVLGEGVKAEGVNYLRSHDGRLWSDLLEASGLTFEMLSEYFTSERFSKRFEDDEVVYRLQRPKMCPNCRSTKISLEFEEDHEMSDSYWKCQCGWEDARATLYLKSQIKAA